jgi:hypothetical protein
MAGLVPAIHDFFRRTKVVDARHEAEHDDFHSLLPDLIRQSMRSARRHGPPSPVVRPARQGVLDTEATPLLILACKKCNHCENKTVPFHMIGRVILEPRMLSFATEFPVNHSSEISEFIQTVRSWILASPHTELTENDFCNVPERGEWSLKKANNHLHILISTGGDDSAALRWKRLDGNLEWDTSVVFSRQASDSWVAIRTSRESIHTIQQLPPARKPIVVRQLMRSLGGALDGELPATEVPYILGDEQVRLAARLILGKAGCRLPVVYISCGFRGDHIVDF